MKEAQIQTLFGAWLKDNWYSSAAFELKLCKGTSLAFDAIAPHQIVGLKAVKDKGLYHKISDNPWIKDSPSFTHPKPFDAFVLKGQAFVCICWYVVRKKKIVYAIDIDTFLSLKKSAGRKSLTEEMARDAATFEVNL